MALVELLTTHSAVSTAAACILVALIPSIWAYVHGFTKLASIPAVGLDSLRYTDFKRAKSRFVNDNLRLLTEGYMKYRKGGIFKLWTPAGFKVIISPDLGHEIRNVPESMLDFNDAVNEQLAGKHMGILNSEVTIKCVRLDLTRHHGRKIPQMAEEARYSFETRFGECKDWTAFPLHPKLLQVVALISGAVFVGVPRNRDNDWLSTAIMFTVDVFQGARALRSKHLPEFLYPIISKFIPEISRVKQHREKARKLITPIIEARNKGIEPPGDDMLQWLMDSAKKPEEKNPDFLAQLLLQVSLASIHTTALTLTNVLFDLCARPEYMQPLREEVDKVLAEEGGFTQAGIKKLWLCDSFIKESQRLTPLGNMTMRRKVVSPDGFTFSNGTHLPKGTIILGIPSAPSTTDTDLWGSNAKEFDGYRFVKLREEDPNKHTFSSTSTLHFGMGKHACPGRFFASTEIKMLLAELVRTYDIRFKGRVGKPDYDCWEMGRTPDPKCEVEFRKREL